jgi:hypothetical protein
MKLRSTIGALAVAGALTLGVAAPAVAEEPTDPPSRACVAAHHVLHDLKVLNRHVNRELRRLERAIERAEANDHPDLAARLQARHDALAARQDRIQAKVQAAAERVRERCGADEPTS